MVEEKEAQHEGLQMSFLDHLDELRRRLVHSVLAVAVAFGVCFYFSDKIYDFLAVPIKEQIKKFNDKKKGLSENTQNVNNLLQEGTIALYTFDQGTVINGVSIAPGSTVQIKIQRIDNRLTALTAQPWVFGKTVLPADTKLPSVFGQGEVAPGFEDNELVITTVGGAFTLYMQVALYAAIAFAIPFLIYQIWAFIAPGLYRHEKKYVAPLLLMASAFFILGATFAYKVAFPAACSYLLELQKGFRTLITANDYFDLITMIMLGLGIVFQIPTIAFLLGRIGLVTPRMLWKGWRYAVVIIAILAAVLTPTADAFNMLVFAAPMLGLYFLSIGIVWLFGKPRRSDAEIRALAHSK